jgi:CheY-like chemotaxis protein
MDGYETTRRIRSMVEYKSIIVIAITAKAMKDDMEKCIQAGCTDYLPKPIDNQKFIDTLNLWLNNR